MKDTSACKSSSHPTRFFQLSLRVWITTDHGYHISARQCIVDIQHWLNSHTQQNLWESVKIELIIGQRSVLAGAIESIGHHGMPEQLLDSLHYSGILVNLSEWAPGEPSILRAHTAGWKWGHEHQQTPFSDAWEVFTDFLWRTMVWGWGR